MTDVVLAAAIGFLFAVGTYLVLRRDVVTVVWGVAILSQAANVYLVTMSSLSGTGVPIIESHGDGGAPATVDPLVQALVLTAIVIGFGTTAFALVLTYRTYEEHGTIDMLELGRRAAETTVADGGTKATVEEPASAASSDSANGSDSADVPASADGSDSADVPASADGSDSADGPEPADGESTRDSPGDDGGADE